MDFQLTDEQRQLKRTVARIAEAEFADSAFSWQGEFPEANVDVLRENDLLGIGLPQEYGGGGYTPVEALLAAEAAVRVCPDTGHVLSRSSLGPPRVIAALGNDHLKETYLPGVCAGEEIFSIAISEPQAGTDASAMETSAEREGDEIVIDGGKTWITKGHVATAFLVYARLEGEIGAFVVEADADGLEIGEGYENMYGGTQVDLFFDDCRIPAENTLAHGREALRELLKEFNVERCHNAMMCVGCGLNAFDKALEHATAREQFDQPIADFQGIEWKFADMATDLDAARLLIYRAAANAADGSPSRLETSMAKLKANEVGNRVVDEALQIHGATGYMREHPLEYLYRLVRGWKIAGGTVESMRNGIAAELKKDGLD
ncbi:MAG: acyl-CoA dehydrogenase family protein [Salinirussus sp.]